MRTWMYMKAYDPTPDYIKQAGEAGWELVTVLYVNTVFIWFFKKWMT